ncbi:MAG: hypothetical protein HFJ48_01820 [Clostridia bacterium]|jgi:hypothetical protein|nr:hypothetical protein [Clostridia bacterium]
MSLKMKLNIVNKQEYEENEDYREIIIKIPKETEKLERDFKYLGLDYNNLSIQNTHVLKCEVIDTDNTEFSAIMSAEISDIIDKGKELGLTTPYQDIKQIFKLINDLSFRERDKLVAILEARMENILNIKDAIKYAKNIDCFELIEVDDEEELARHLICNGDIDIEDIIDYTDLDRLGQDYADNKNVKKTAQGYLKQECDLKSEIKKEEEEEFE